MDRRSALKAFEEIEEFAARTFDLNMVVLDGIFTAAFSSMERARAYIRSRVRRDHYFASRMREGCVSILSVKVDDDDDEGAGRLETVVTE